MLKQCLSLIIASTLILNFAAVSHARTRPQDSAAQAAVKQKAESILDGSMVEVRLLSREKFRGRIGEFTKDGFSLQIKKEGTLQKRTVLFSELKSIKEVHSGSKTETVGKTTVMVLAAVGAAVLIMVIACASGKCGG